MAVQRTTHITFEDPRPIQNGTLFNCPFCNERQFKPARKSKVEDHLEGHLNRAVVLEGLTIHRCGLGCQEKLHYHCPYCPGVIFKRNDFLTHLLKHKSSVSSSCSPALWPSLSTVSSSALWPSLSTVSWLFTWSRQFSPCALWPSLSTVSWLFTWSRQFSPCALWRSLSTVSSSALWPSLSTVSWSFTWSCQFSPSALWPSLSTVSWPFTCSSQLPKKKSVGKNCDPKKVPLFAIF
ncbi:uncharacterized protein LOC115577360 [Sparus aurata]|uniref:uncharacterized protein LOC115577360 n=1 Tax=Sparus aurata TaxID=8175 RepID=UPI0011C0FC78|nr:uncharacterized protein LOC115577360 [Sparus aurata]